MAAEVAAKDANLQQQLQAVKEAAKKKEALMASVLRDHTVQAVAAIRRDRAVAVAKLEERAAQAAAEARQVVEEV